MVKTKHRAPKLIRRLMCFLMGHELVLVWYGPIKAEVYCNRCRNILPCAMRVGEAHGKTDKNLSMWLKDQ